METQKVIRIVLTLGVLLAGSYYINKTTTLSEVLSDDLIQDVQADVCTKC